MTGPNLTKQSFQYPVEQIDHDNDDATVEQPDSCRIMIGAPAPQKRDAIACNKRQEHDRGCDRADIDQCLINRRLK